MKFLKAGTMEERLEVMKDLSRNFWLRANDINKNGVFPYDNIKDLKNSGYTALTVPSELGGEGISLLELVRLQEMLAAGDGSTALAIGWHMGIIMNLAEKRSWKGSLFEFLCEQVMSGSLINSAATEVNTGSPTRGGRPETTAEKIGSNWQVSGRKTFTTLSPVLDFFIVSASIKDANTVANFLIPRSSDGVIIEETWDSIAMQGTGSHDLVMNKVLVPEEYLVEMLTPGRKQASGWLLHIPACYLGIAKSAQQFAIQFASEYSPNSIKGTISELPAVQQKMGEMELRRLQAEYLLYGVANQWDTASEMERQKMGPELGAAKLTVTNIAIEMVDLAMRIVGARSLSLKNPLQRLYRDVRAGLHNPPMDDMTIQQLAQSSLRSHSNV